MKGIHQQDGEIRRDVFSDVLSEDSIHQTLEHRGGIAQAKGHVFEHEEALVCDERCFWPFLDANGDLVISPQQVEGYDAMRVVKFWENLVNTRQGILVLQGLLIEVPIIHAHPKPANLLGNYYDVACVGAYSWICR